LGDFPYIPVNFKLWESPGRAGGLPALIFSDFRPLLTGNFDLGTANFIQYFQYLDFFRKGIRRVFFCALEVKNGDFFGK